MFYDVTSQSIFLGIKMVPPTEMHILIYILPTQQPWTINIRTMFGVQILPQFFPTIQSALKDH